MELTTVVGRLMPRIEIKEDELKFVPMTVTTVGFAVPVTRLAGLNEVMVGAP